MDNDAIGPGTTAALPRTQPFASAVPATSPPLGGALAETDGNDRTGVFAQLVGDDSDIAGLVAYSIYKQNKLDWLRAFETARGRPPNDVELAAYIIGEGTPRRLATYRHLAEATLNGHGPTIGDGGTSVGGGAYPRRKPASLDEGQLSPTRLAIYLAVAVVVVIGAWLAIHFTLASR